MEGIDNGISSMWSHSDKSLEQRRDISYLSVSVWRGCGIRVMSIIWERNGQRRVHDLSQTRKLGCFLFSPVCNLLVMLNTPGKQKQNAKLFGNSSSLSPLAGGGGRERVINIKTKYLDGDHFGNISLRGKETCYVFILDPLFLTNWGNDKDWILISLRRPR